MNNTSARTIPFINNPTDPFNAINISKNSKILGHLMTHNNDGYENADYRLLKAKTALNLAKTALLPVIISTNRRVNLYNDVILSILTYSLQLSI